MDAGVCAKGSWAARSLGFPACWDGVNVDTPDHRGNVVFGSSAGNVCRTATHPVRLPQISLLISYRVDQDFLDGKWRLSSDEMAACYDTDNKAGCTEHGDYWEAWSDTVRDMWFTNCNLAHNSCTNDLGNGTVLKFMDKNFDGTHSANIFGSPYQMNDATPPMDFGMSRDVTTNGSKTFYLISPDDGVWGFMGLKGFSGSIDNIHVTDLGPTAKGPVTVHN
jgi:hypothetical protein